MNPDTPQSGRRAGGKVSRSNAAAGDSSSFDTNAGDAQSSTSGGSVAGMPAQSSDYAAIGTGEVGSVTGDPSGTVSSSRLVDQVKEKATSQIRAQKDRATAGLGGVADAVRQTGRQLRDQRQDAMAQVVEGAAVQLERLASHLKDRSLEELLGDAQRLARQQPALFVGGSFAAGLLAARFIKASSPRGRGDWEASHGPRGDASRSGESIYGSGSPSGPTVFGSGTGSSSFNTTERPGTGDVQGRGGL